MNQRLRVLQVIDSLAPAGAERSLAMLAPHLLGEGIDLHIAYLVERDGLRRDLTGAGIPVVSLATGNRDRRRWLRRTIDLVQHLQPDVVHTTLFEADLAGRRAAARLGIPCVSSLVNTVYGRTEASRDDLPRLKLRAAQAIDALTARRVTRFHAVTQHVAAVMRRRLMIPAHKIEVIPRGRDASALGRRSVERSRVTRRRLGVAANVPLILAVGRQEPQKGLDILLMALAAVRSQFPDARLVVAGREGRATSKLTQLAASLELGDAVSFLGLRDDVPDLLAAADVLAYPSLWEGAAGTLVEAMALECPIVTTLLPTLLEAVDESTAELVSPGNAEDLARGLIDVLAHPQDLPTRTHAARARFEAEFTIQTSARRMADLYARVAAPSPVSSLQATGDDGPPARL